MRISQVCSRFGAPGGVEQHVLAISRQFVKFGHEVTVHTSDLRSEAPWETGREFAEQDGLTVRRYPAYKGVLPHMGYLVIPGIITGLLSDPGDIIHAHSHRYFHYEAAATVSRAVGRPLVLSPHYHPPADDTGLLERLTLRLYDFQSARRVYRYASRVLTMTDLEKAYLSPFVPGPKCTTVGAGIDPSEWENPDPVPFRDKFALDGPYILYAGRLATNKGLMHLVEAFAGLEDGGVKLVLAGQDWGMGAAIRRRVAAARLEKRVVLAGHLDDRLYRSAMKGCEFLVLPSEWEAFGIVLLEAMMCGRPVVASAVGGVPDVVGEGVDGHLVPYGDVAAIGDRIRKLLADKGLRERMGAAGRAKVLERFTWAKVARKVLDVYEGAAS